MSKRSKTKHQLKKYFSLIMILFILSTSIPIPKVSAETEGDGGNSANDMTRSMINFFREDRQTIQADRVAVDEYTVYGVFLSNFYIPWSTKLSDLVSEDENSIPNKVSKKFFGSTSNTSQIVELNKKLHDAINGILGFEGARFALYRDREGKQLLTGQHLFEMMGKSGDRLVYDVNGQVVIMLDDPAMQATLQILFGFQPDYMVNPDKGLRDLSGFYMDGLGNIWGAPKGAGVSDYVIVIPAAMNPIVFPNANKGYGFPAKLPVSNVFTMGGTLRITENFLDPLKASYDTPYYNINEYVSKNDFNNNVISIFGINSPLDYIGDSESIIRRGVDSNPWSRVKSFLEGSDSNRMTTDTSSIMVSVNTSRLGNISTHLSKSSNGLKGNEERIEWLRYLTNSTTFKMDNIADYMYYFDTPNASSENASGGEGSFANVTDLIREQKMFAKETEEGSGEYNFYNNSYMPSPFNVFIKKLWERSSTEQDTYLKSELNISDRKMDSVEYRALKTFLNTGSWGSSTDDTINDAMKIFSKGKNYAYNILPPAKTLEKITTDKLVWDFLALYKEPTSFAMTSKDRDATMMSIAANNSNVFTQLAERYRVSKYAPFDPDSGGGDINGTLTDKNKNSISALFHNFMTYRIFSMNSTFANQLSGDKAGAGKYKTPWEDGMVNKTAVMNDKNNFPGIYWGYMVELLQIKPSEDGTKFSDPVSYNNPLLPHMDIDTNGGGIDLNDIFGTSGVVASEDRTLEEMQRDIIQKVYGLLSEGPNDYRDKLIKSTQDSWIISTHRAITGSWVGDTLSVSSGADGSYASVVGYINTPGLTELPLTEWVVTDYMYIYMFLLLLVLILMIMMILTSMRTLRDGILIFILMCFVLIIPQFLVGNVINISNKIGDSIYSERFNYWAITQHQQSHTEAGRARMTGDEMDYIIAQNMQNVENVYSADVGVRLKWMSPKKDDVFNSIFNRNTASQDLLSNLTLFRWLTSSFMNQEEYVHDDPMATYLYRPYNAIAQEAKKSYEALKDEEADKADILKSVTAHESKVLGLPSYRYDKYKNPGGKVNFVPEQKALIEEAGPYKTSTNIGEEEIEKYRYWAMQNENVTKAMFRSEYSGAAGLDTSNLLTDPGYNAYTLLTESPFYYFYNVLSHRYAHRDADFKSALLDVDVFKVRSEDTRINNATRDFLDMEGLFTYVIPYMNQGNEYVYGWTDIYGRDISGFDFQPGTEPTIDSDEAKIKNEQERLKAKYSSEKSKKENLTRVWKMYTPWVDQLYSLGVRNKKVTVARNSVIVDDTLNPASYESVGRPMIFSESDMYAKSYQLSDLSDIEMRIQDTLNETYTDLMYLTNYYDFDDEVLITAAAMTATFNFNKNFSENRLIGESNILYPQNFELKNFNYDAFLRLMLLNATGEPLMAEQDLYVRILDNTSIFTGILLILADIMAVIIIPTAKVVVLLLLLFLSIAVSISCVLSPPQNIIKVVLKHLGLPSLLFLVASGLFAFVISLFMGEGLTGYVGGRAPELGVSDPTVMLGLMLVVNIIYLFFLWKIIRLLIDTSGGHIKTSFFSTAALVAGAGAAIMGSVKQTARTAYDKQTSRSRHKEMIDAMNGSNAQGAGGMVGASGMPAGSGAGGSEASGSSGGLDNEVRPNIQRDRDESNVTEERDSTFKDDIDNLASNRDNSKDVGVDREQTPEKKKSVGHKMVDFKHSVKDATFKVKDGIEYTTSKEGLKGDIGEATTQARKKANNYVNDVRQYDADRELKRVMDLDSKKGSRNVEQRQNRGFERIDKIERKIQATNQRNALLDQKNKSK